MEKPTHSDCCVASILFDEPNEAKYYTGYDRCSKCNKIICYAIMSTRWASNESCGVFEKYDGTKWFFWQQVTCWKSVEELCYADRQQYLGQLKSIVDSLTANLNKDGDQIHLGDHIYFMASWAPQVQNPEIAKLL